MPHTMHCMLWNALPRCVVPCILYTEPCSILSCAVLQVEKGVALRARMQLERLRAEKEKRAKEQQAKADADAARK